MRRLLWFGTRFELAIMRTGFWKTLCSAIYNHVHYAMGPGNTYGTSTFAQTGSRHIAYATRTVVTVCDRTPPQIMACKCEMNPKRPAVIKTRLFILVRPCYPRVPGLWMTGASIKQRKGFLAEKELTRTNKFSQHAARSTLTSACLSAAAEESKILWHLVNSSINIRKTDRS